MSRTIDLACCLAVSLLINVASAGAEAAPGGAVNVVAGVQNLLANPGFDHSLQGWTVVHDGATASWQAPDADGSPGSGSAKLTFRSVGYLRVDALTQCVPVTPGTRYSLSGKLRTHAVLAGHIQPLVIDFFSGANCTGPNLGGGGPYVDPPPPDWTGLINPLVPPDGAQSALIRLIAHSEGALESFELDDVYFGVSDTNTCVPSATMLCLDWNPGDHRFAVQAMFSSPARAIQGTAGAVSTAPLGITRGGVLWFFDPTNPELLVKVIDGCGLTGHFWVYISAGTDVGVELTITDSFFLGATYLFRSPDGFAFPSIQNVYAILCPT